MGYVIIGAVIGAFVAAVFAIAKKDAKERDEMISKLSNEEKERIMKAEPQFVEENAWVQEAYVAKIVEKGSKSDVRLLWYNTTMNNNENETITIADASISKADKEAHNVKVGDFVQLDDNYHVIPGNAGQELIGVCVGVRDGYAAVQTSGYVEADYQGDVNYGRCGLVTTTSTKLAPGGSTKYRIIYKDDEKIGFIL